MHSLIIFVFISYSLLLYYIDKSISMSNIISVISYEASYGYSRMYYPRLSSIDIF